MNKIQSEAFFLVKTGSPEQAFERRAFEINSPVNREVLIEVEAFGLNYADVMARRGLYNDAPPFPAIIGYEVVGKIVACGPEANPALVGNRVVAFCRFGGYAKHVLTSVMSIVPVGNEPAEQLLALCTQAVTAFYMAEYLTPIHKIDTILIHAAAGGVGTILIQLAKLKGAKVIAKIGRDEKADLVKKLGADFVVNYIASDYTEQIKNYLKGEKLDMSFNPVGGSTYKKDMTLLGSGGRIVLFGGSELSKGKWGIFSKLNFVRKMGLILPIGLMMKSKNILGVNMLKIADNKPQVLEHCLKEVMELFSKGKITPQVGGKFNADQLNEAHSLLESGKSTGKLSVFWEN